MLVTRLAKSRTAPTTRRQNMSNRPKSAAKADAIGIRESGPIYTLIFSSALQAAVLEAAVLQTALAYVVKPTGVAQQPTFGPLAHPVTYWPTLLQEQRAYKTSGLSGA